MNYKFKCTNKNCQNEEEKEIVLEEGQIEEESVSELVQNSEEEEEPKE